MGSTPVGTTRRKDFRLVSGPAPIFVVSVKAKHALRKRLEVEVV